LGLHSANVASGSEYSVTAFGEQMLQWSIAVLTECQCLLNLRVSVLSTEPISRRMRRCCSFSCLPRASDLKFIVSTSSSHFSASVSCSSFPSLHLFLFRDITPLLLRTSMLPSLSLRFSFYFRPTCCTFALQGRLSLGGACVRVSSSILRTLSLKLNLAFSPPYMLFPFLTSPSFLALFSFLRAFE
jgi:hypothetical protein